MWRDTAGHIIEELFKGMQIPTAVAPAIAAVAVALFDKAKAEALERDLVAEIPRLKPGPAVQ